MAQVMEKKPQAHHGDNSARKERRLQQTRELVASNKRNIVLIERPSKNSRPTAPQSSPEQLQDMWRALDTLLSDLENSIAQQCNMPDALEHTRHRALQSIELLLLHMFSKSVPLSDTHLQSLQNLVHVTCTLFAGMMRHTRTSEAKEKLTTDACEMLERVVNVIKILGMEDVPEAYLSRQVFMLCQTFPRTVQCLPYFLRFAESIVDLLVFNYHIVEMPTSESERHRVQQQLFHDIMISYLHLYNYTDGTALEESLPISPLDEVWRLLRTMSNRGVVPSRETCDNVMVIGPKNKSSKLRLFEYLCDQFKGLAVLSPIGYGSLLADCLLAEDAEAIAMVQADMVSKSVPLYDANIHLAHLNYYINRKDVLGAENYLTEQIRHDTVQRGLLAFHLMHAYLNNSDHREKAVPLFERTILPKFRDMLHTAEKRGTVATIHPSQKQYFVQTQDHWKVAFRCLRTMIDHYQSDSRKMEALEEGRERHHESNNSEKVELVYHMMSFLRYSVQGIPHVLYNLMYKRQDYTFR